VAWRDDQAGGEKFAQLPDLGAQFFWFSADHQVLCVNAAAERDLAMEIVGQRLGVHPGGQCLDGVDHIGTEFDEVRDDFGDGPAGVMDDFEAVAVRLLDEASGAREDKFAERVR